MSIDEDSPVAAILTDLEIFQAVCEQDRAMKVDDPDGDECVEENPPTNGEMKQTPDILKRGVQHRSTNFKNNMNTNNINEMLRNNCRQTTINAFF
ncbi:hypothetical protein AVEN_249202-1 [Araneus ventricosus]|uniref:Uncharacterized protein n=1 Tax=Araneus ventricosus TaxID=182803 RepID=A0A4Y2VYM9_ARAVE|nr:hypothetical protein AVEN_249202-1 [Araneus ventricosus]